MSIKTNTDVSKVTNMEKEKVIFPSRAISGVAKTFVDAHTEFLESPEPFWYFSFLTALGSMIGDKVKLKDGLGIEPRLYTLLLGESANTRKSFAIERTLEFFTENGGDFCTCKGLGSAEGLPRKFKENRNLLLVHDEFSSFVSKCKISSSILLPCISSLFENNSFENGTKKTEFFISDAHLSMLGASTLDTYDDIWDQAFIKMGFYNRLFIVPGTGKKKPCMRPKKIEKVKMRKLKLDFSEMKDFIGDTKEITVTKKGDRLLNKWYASFPSSIHSKRIDGYCSRFLILLTLNELKQEADVSIVKKAIRLMNWEFSIRRQMDPIDCENRFAKMEIKIRRALFNSPLTERRLRQITNADKSGLWIFKGSLENLKKSEDIFFNRKENVLMLNPRIGA